MWSLLAFLFTTASLAFCDSHAKKEMDQPNIILILADDLGFNDIGYNNPSVISPNIDQLASQGVILDRNYGQPICSPARAALMTGRYPYKMGRQGLLPINAFQPTGLNLEFTLLPQTLRQNGYATHLVGKWHLGFCDEKFLPTNRGFDSFYGFWNGAEGYYNKTILYSYNGIHYTDFHDNDVVIADNDTFSTDLYIEKTTEIIGSHDKSKPLFMYIPMQNVHTPLQVPKSYEELYPDVQDPARRKYLGLVTNMDDYVGAIIKALKANDMYENSVIIFSSDNGGAPGHAGASNFPLRGYKGTLYEGGIRVPGFVHSPKYVQNPGRIYDKLVHLTDWYPTLVKLAGISDPSMADLDGVDQMQALFNDDGNVTPRELLVNELGTAGLDSHRGVVQNGQGWKLLRNARYSTVFDKYVLFNVRDDPSETVDYKSVYPDLFESMKTQMENLLSEMLPEDNPPYDPAVDISDGNGNLASGWCPQS